MPLSSTYIGAVPLSSPLFVAATINQMHLMCSPAQFFFPRLVLILFNLFTPISTLHFLLLYCSFSHFLNKTLVAISSSIILFFLFPLSLCILIVVSHDYYSLFLFAPGPLLLPKLATQVVFPPSQVASSLSSAQSPKTHHPTPIFQISANTAPY